ncbi:MAG TPA: GerMN domain-containing protein [Treponemataceae bacterium]|nr:GerMN domain-containing protein [Spirochaetota bacterium]NMA56157.1 hypothetical protein [Treponema sp.]HOQ93124.1 GerMN domain-containing protein [Treponemataceae bacterium]
MIHIEKKKIVALIILASLCIISLSLFFIFNKKARFVFYFQHRDTGVLQVESRYLPKVKKGDRLNLLIDELLLGPMADRSLPLFPRNTRSLSTALVGKTLYVNLSSEALNILDEASTNKEGAALFRKNIFRNVRKIDIIQIYIDGSSIYENEGF